MANPETQSSSLQWYTLGLTFLCGPLLGFLSCVSMIMYENYLRGDVFLPLFGSWNNTQLVAATIFGTICGLPVAFLTLPIAVMTQKVPVRPIGIAFVLSLFAFIVSMFVSYDRETAGFTLSLLMAIISTVGTLTVAYVMAYRKRKTGFLLSQE